MVLLLTSWPSRKPSVSTSTTVLLSLQLADHRLVGLFAAAADRLLAPEPAALLIGHLDHEVLLEQARLVERAAVRRPVRGDAGNDRVGLSRPFALDVRDLIGRERRMHACSKRHGARERGPGAWNSDHVCSPRNKVAHQARSHL